MHRMGLAEGSTEPDMCPRQPNAGASSAGWQAGPSIDKFWPSALQVCIL